MFHSFFFFPIRFYFNGYLSHNSFLNWFSQIRFDSIQEPSDNKWQKGRRKRWNWWRIVNLWFNQYIGHWTSESSVCVFSVVKLVKPKIGNHFHLYVSVSIQEWPEDWNFEFRIQINEFNRSSLVHILYFLAPIRFRFGSALCVLL